MRGPLDETQKKCMVEKGLGKPSMRRKVHTSAESGTCNVCSAPCSSCRHLKPACMGSKGDEFSDETCRVTASSQYSNNDGDGLVSFKSRARDSLQHTTSEASNLLSVSSSHDSLSENAESKVNRKSSDADASAESLMRLKMSSGRAIAEDQFSPKAESFPDQKTFSKNNVDSKSEEGHDDNMSCVSRANDASKVVGYYNKNLDMKNCLHSSALEVEGSGKAPFSHKSGSFETPSNDVDACSSSPKVQTKCLSSNSNGKHLDEDPALHDHGKRFECPTEQVNLSLSKEASANIDCVGNLAAHNISDNNANGKSTLNADSSEVSCKINSKLELEADKDSGDQADEGFKCSDQVERKEKLNESDELADMQEPTLQSASGDESDESEILEHDVKVCDICGDAGREDFLAICSRCADGAEHIYCMREMLQKLPEGDWLCEECKLAEEAENQKQDAEEKRMNVASTQSSGKRHAEHMELALAPKRQATETSLASPKSCSPSRIAAVSRDTSFKSLDKGKVKIAHQTSFGNRSNIDLPEIARPSVNGPHVQTPKGALLKSNSFNTLNSKMKVKLVDEVPQKHKGARESSLDMKEGTARMMRKSMSFKSASSGRSSTNELKVKMLSSKFSHIQDSRGLKQVKDRDAVDRKKLLRLGRPPGSSMTSSAVVSTPKVDQGFTRGESVIASSTGNNRELKSAQSNGKLGTLSRSTSSAGCKGADTPVTSVQASSKNGISSNSAEQKLNQINPKDEPSSSSWNAASNATENLQDGLPRSRESSNQGEKARENSLSRLRPAGITGLKNVTCQKCKEICHATENCTVVSPLASGTDVSASRIPKEEMSKGRKLKAAIEAAAMLKKPGIYRKKKEIDQSDGLSSSNVDESGEIASQDQLSVLNKMSEGTDEGQANISASSSDFCKSTIINNVKQLNEHSNDAVCPFKVGSDSIAPYLGKPVHDSAEKSVLTKMGSDSTSPYLGKPVHASSSEFCKSTNISNVKQLNEHSNDAVCPFKVGSDSIAPYLGKPVHDSVEKSVLTKMGSDSTSPYLGKPVQASSSEFCKSTNISNVKQLNEHSNDAVCPFKVGSDSIAPYLKSVHASAEKSVLAKMSAIPEHEYIWQGVFEVHRAEKVIDLYDGIQAHLSTCASPKVLDVVSKFPQKIKLDEVPCISTWPRQFLVTGVKEENIALYFFAKNFESYENYKRLLDNMIKKDLALKGSFEGVEFFIFPSTQLPENSQRWNMLYFLWGVFRGRRSDCSDSFKKLVMPSLNGVPRDKDIPAAVMTSSENIFVPECIVKNTSACDSPCSSDVHLAANAPEKPSVSLNGNSDDKVFNSQTNLEKQDGKVDSRSLTNIRGSSNPWCPEARCSSPCLEEVGPPRCSLDVDPKPCTEVTRTNSVSDVKEIQIHEGGSCLGEDMPSFKIFGVGSQNSGCRRIFGEDTIVDRTFSDKDNIIVERDLNDDNVNMDVETFSGKGPRKRPFLYLSDSAPLISSSMTPWNKADNNNTLVDGESISKKLKTGFSGRYGGSGSRDENSLSGSFTSQTCDLGSSSSVEERSYDKASAEKVILEGLGTSERYFFPVDSHHVKDSRFPAISMPWNSSNDEDPVIDGIPNLELALGAETKSPNKGILPFFGMAEKNRIQNKPPDKVMNKEEDDGVSASLSLSLSFPFPDKEQTVKPVSKTEQLVPERCHVNTSLLLFRGLSDK
ncbi:PREDICTED: uncharacterized protein LOC105116774 isoform X2 [Populus euphratica]|uniref:Uncharacterized protein LOC105116774 isoform X2 n=2 Tax=Populus euphratica TaxID=75702 RepID=A0AAJ6XBL3_POPEU|nr:PREDICTED: uncharacterized protein LOC105116774 isoform X2 [Populus euphratica]